jgi:hypothetical protein
MVRIANEREIPSRYEADIVDAADRAVAVQAREPLEYIGIGMTGVVFCDARGIGYKAARRPDHKIDRLMIAEEAEWLRVRRGVAETTNATRCTNKLTAR